MGLASCKVGPGDTRFKPGAEVGVNTDLVKYVASRSAGTYTTLYFIDNTTLLIEGGLEEYRAARVLSEQEDASAWGK
jgi:hypothetical protein